jgi:predicted kinase
MLSTHSVQTKHFTLSKEKNMPKLYMLIGVPASGKSTWLKKNMSPDGVIVSSDDHVERLAAMQGKTYNEAFNDVASDATRAMMTDLSDAIAAQKDIYWDQTNTGEKSRAKKLKQVPSNYEKVAVYFPTPDDEEHQRRLASRPDKTIPDFVIKSMKSSLQAPSRDEGFDDIVVA